MIKTTGRVFAALALLAALGLQIGCGGGGDGGGSASQTTTLQHPLFPSTVGDTWTYDWYDYGTAVVTHTSTETVTSVSGNSLTISDDTGEEHYFEIRQDQQGIYVVQTGGTGYTLSPPIVIIPPDLTPGLTYNGGSYTLTFTGIGQWTCTSYALWPAIGDLTVPAGTFPSAQVIVGTQYWQTGHVGSYNQVYAAGVGRVQSWVPVFNPDQGQTDTGWTVSLTGYIVH